MPGPHPHGRSNYFEDKQKFIVDDISAAEMPKGSVLVYTGALHRGGGAYRSEGVRCGVNITKQRVVAGQVENQ